MGSYQDMKRQKDQGGSVFARPPMRGPQPAQPVGPPGRMGGPDQFARPSQPVDQAAPMGGPTQSQPTPPTGMGASPPQGGGLARPIFAPTYPLPPAAGQTGTGLPPQAPIGVNRPPAVMAGQSPMPQPPGIGVTGSGLPPGGIGGPVPPPSGPPSGGIGGPPPSGGGNVPPIQPPLGTPPPPAPPIQPPLGTPPPPAGGPPRQAKRPPGDSVFA